MNTPHHNSIEEEFLTFYKALPPKHRDINYYHLTLDELLDFATRIAEASRREGYEEGLTFEMQAHSEEIAQARKEGYEEGKSHFLQEQWLGKVIDGVAYRREVLELILKQARREAVLEFMGSQNYKDAMKVAEMDGEAKGRREAVEEVLDKLEQVVNNTWHLLDNEHEYIDICAIQKFAQRERSQFLNGKGANN